MSAPVPHTCPLLNCAIDEIEEVNDCLDKIIYSKDNGCDAIEEANNKLHLIESIKQTIEVIRTHNTELRDWGEENESKAESLEEDISTFQNENDSLKCDLEILNVELKQLQELVN